MLPEAVLSVRGEPRSTASKTRFTQVRGCLHREEGGRLGLLWGWIQLFNLRHPGFSRRRQPHVCISLEVIQGLEEYDADLMCQVQRSDQERRDE